MRDPGRHEHDRLASPTGGKIGTNCGTFRLIRNDVGFQVTISDTDGWDHLAVSIVDRLRRPVERCPTWEELRWVKNRFFATDETVAQFHQAENELLNIHPYTLHLWRPQGHAIVMPPARLL